MKKTLIVALSALALASCGGGNSNNNQAQNAQSPESNQTAQQSSSAETNAPKNADGQIVLSGNIDKNVTWKDLGLPVDYIVEGSLYLDGNSLVTVEPGVTIMFAGADGRIEVGENAGIKMQGTKDKPIVLTGPLNNQNVGAWDYVLIRSNRADNILEYVEFKNGGAGEWLLVMDGKASIKNCTFDGASHNGVSIGQDATLTAFENNTIKNCKEYPLTFHHNEQLKNFGTGNVFEGNGKQFINCPMRWLDAENFEYVIHKADIPYFYNDGFGTNGRTKVTIDPGAKFALNRGTWVEFNADAIIKINGTAQEPVIFDGLEDKPGFWDGVTIDTHEDESVIQYCNFVNVGNKNSDDRAVFVGRDFECAIKNVSISKTKAATGIIFDYLDNAKKSKLADITVDNSPSGNKFLLNTTDKDDVELPAASLADILKKL